MYNVNNEQKGSLIIKFTIKSKFYNHYEKIGKLYNVYNPLIKEYYISINNNKYGGVLYGY